MVPLVDPAKVVDAREIHDDAGSYRSARHTASRAARDEIGPRLRRPLHECDDILGIYRNGNSRWNLAPDAGSLGIHGASEIVFAKITAESRKAHNPRLLTRGGVVE
jgi:hypothetical protein